VHNFTIHFTSLSKLCKYAKGNPFSWTNLTCFHFSSSKCVGSHTKHLRDALRVVPPMLNMTLQKYSHIQFFFLPTHLNQSNYLANQQLLGSSMPFTYFNILCKNVGWKLFYWPKLTCFNFFHPILLGHILRIVGVILRPFPLATL
jgi:hypothetical protein